MNSYIVTLKHKDGSVLSFTVASNNIPFAIENAIKEAIRSTGKTGWRYDTHRLIRSRS